MPRGARGPHPTRPSIAAQDLDLVHVDVAHVAESLAHDLHEVGVVPVDAGVWADLDGLLVRLGDAVEEAPPPHVLRTPVVHVIAPFFDAESDVNPEALAARGPGEPPTV